MRKLVFSIIGLSAALNLFSQNVGIGTTTPTEKLHVLGAVNTDVMVKTEAVGTGGSASFTAKGSGGVFDLFQLTKYNSAASGSIAGVNLANLSLLYSGANAGPMLLDVITNNPMHFGTSNNVRLTISNTGQVGIGTISPNYLLHINGGDLFVQSSSGSIKFGYQGSNQWHWATTGGGADLLLRSSPDDNTPTTRLYLTQAGRVGIGSTTPAAPLHINTTTGEVLRIQGVSPWIRFEDNTDGYTGYLWYNGTDMVLAGTAGHSLRFVSNGGYKMAINTDGRVSIGASNLLATGYLLNVDGKIISEELKIQLSTGWPDYVFGNEYKLMPIEDLEKSIRQNKHLPNIPSAASIAANQGFEVGDISKRLLEKVEELTLYMIDANKKIQSLEEKIKTLENKVKQ